MSAALLALSLACACGDFPAEVARRAKLMAADVETMPHVVREGLRQLAYDAKVCAEREAAKERLRSELREVIRQNREAFVVDWPAVEAAIRDAARETSR